MNHSRILLIVERDLNFNHLIEKINKLTQIDVFSLSSEIFEGSRFHSKLKNNGFKNISFYESARLIENEVENLRRVFLPWLSKLADSEIDGVSLKKFLLHDNSPLSSWWMGQFSERNPLKREEFVQIAQLCAIDKLLNSQVYSSCVVSIKNNILRDAIQQSCDSISLSYFNVVKPKLRSLISKLKNKYNIFNYFGALLSFIKIFVISIITNLKLSLNSDIFIQSPYILIISYFDPIENIEDRTTFQSKFTVPLQSILEQNNKRIVWLQIRNEAGGRSIFQILRLVKKYKNAGTNILLLDQILDVKYFFIVLKRYLIQCFKAHRIIGSIINEKNFPLPTSAKMILKDLWLSSYTGREAVHGQFLIASFDQLSKMVDNKMENCVYLCEMQPWEKALCASFRNQSREFRTIGFLHTSVSRNYWPYNFLAEDFVSLEDRENLPLPNILAVGGNIQATLINKPTQVELTIVESLRYLGLSEVLRAQKNKSICFTILVAGSIDRRETLALLRMIFSQTNLPENAKVILRGHPYLPILPLLQELGIISLPKNFDINEDDLYSALDMSWAVLVPASTVAIEALAFGCKVIVPIFPEAIDMNPLSSFSQYCYTVCSNSDLQELIFKIFQEGKPSGVLKSEIIEFLNGYWNMDAELTRWKKILHIL